MAFAQSKISPELVSSMPDTLVIVSLPQTEQAEPALSARFAETDLFLVNTSDKITDPENRA
jgi:hypothetical protein